MVLIESTYGDRRHAEVLMEDELAPLLSKLAARGGVAVVPVFAVGRAQQLQLAITRLKEAGAFLPRCRCSSTAPWPSAPPGCLGEHLGAHRLSHAELAQMARGTTLVETTEESKALARLHGPRVILAASGMATGGRVLHHLALHAGHHRNLILLTSCKPQARAAHAWRLEKTLRMLGQEVSIRAQVEQLQSASAHADAEQLLAWLQQVQPAPAPGVCHPRRHGRL